AWLSPRSRLASLVPYTTLFRSACGVFAGLRPVPARRIVWMDVLTWSAAWAGTEWLRSILFSGFPWLNIGYAHVDSPLAGWAPLRSEEHTSELQSRFDLVCRLLL